MPPAGWIELFDRKSLADWTEEQGARWSVSASEIVGAAGSDGWGGRGSGSMVPGSFHVLVFGE